MKNKYADWCLTCDKKVHIGQGQLYKIEGVWRVKHDKCIKDTRFERSCIRRNNELLESPQMRLPI